VFRLVAILCGIHAVGSQRRLYVNPNLPEWLPSITLRNLWAGWGAANLRMERDRLEVLSNTTGFHIVHGGPPRPSLPESLVGNGSLTHYDAAPPDNVLRGGSS